MQPMKQIKILLVLFFIIVQTANAQSISKDDYRRAVSYMHANYNNKTVFNLHTTVNWFKDSTGIWFIDYSKSGKAYKTVSFSNYQIQNLFDQDKLADAFNGLLEKDIKANDFELSNIERAENGNLTISHKNKSYALDLNTYTLLPIEEEKKEENNPFETKSPDGKWIAYTKDYNLYIKSTGSDEEFQLSFEGKRGYEYASWYGWYDKMEGENGERPKRFYVNWSEDSQWIATSIVDTRNAEKMYLLDHSIDSLYKPKLLSYFRGSPGDTTMVHIEPVFYNIESKKEVPTNLPKGTHINSVAIEWTKDSGILLANYSERGYKKELLKKVNLNNGLEETVIELNSSTNIDNFWFRYLTDLDKVLFLSEETGWRQLYLADLNTNTIQPFTIGNYFINSVLHVDSENKVVYISASGKENNSNPYHQKIYKIDLDGTLTLLTPENTHHSVQFSEDGMHFTDNYSAIDTPTKTVLRESLSGKILAELTNADASKAISNGWQEPEVFQLTAKDKKTTIYGAIWKPSNFDPSKSYPIIDATYTGPHTQIFPKTYSGIFWYQSMAELGFIVMVVDGLGTSGRSKEFHDHSYKNMGNNLEDHVLAIKYLGNKYTWIDVDRVGIYGHSAGGYDTGRAMLAFPDFYKVGVASSADHDFRMEKAWWPEMYQGWPVDSTYQDVSNVTNAGNLKGKLLLVHGGLDDNVNPSATFKLAEELVKADKEFDLLIFPSQRHGYQGEFRNYFIKKRWNYFIEHLRGEKPIWDFKWD
jgi:dipeptidyl aminopeptidase/acylaminoacyl peptidase